MDDASSVRNEFRVKPVKVLYPLTKTVEILILPFQCMHDCLLQGQGAALIPGGIKLLLA